jgi:hypothetical protein
MSAERPYTLPPGFVLASEVERRYVQWLHRGRVPLSEITGLGGDGGYGKSTVAQDLAARTSRGTLGQLPDGSDVTEPRGVVILTAEESIESVVKPRLAAMGADLGRCSLLVEDVTATTRPLTLPSGQERLDAAVRAVDAALVIVDTGPGFLDPGLNSNGEEDIRAFFRALAIIAREHECAVIVIVHLNKDRTPSARGRVMGGAAWTNVPRSTLILGTPDGEDPQDTLDRALAVSKANLIAGKAPDALGLRIVTSPDDPTVAVVEWTGARPDLRADDPPAAWAPTSGVSATTAPRRSRSCWPAGRSRRGRHRRRSRRPASHGRRFAARGSRSASPARRGASTRTGSGGRTCGGCQTQTPPPPVCHPVSTRGSEAHLWSHRCSPHTDAHGGASRARA